MPREYTPSTDCTHLERKPIALRPQVGDINVVESVTSSAQQAYPLPDDLYDSKDWRQGNYASRVEWLHTMYENAKRERDELAAQQAVPMTRGEKLAAWEAATIELPSPLNCYLRGIADAEAHHGITAQGAGEV